MPINLPKPNLAPGQFPSDILRDVDSLRVTPSVLSGRLPINAISVDPPAAKERDDAIHVEPNETLGVTIVDPSSLCSAPSVVREVLSRGETGFTGSRAVPMLPEVLSRERFSLVTGGSERKPTITAFTAVSADQRRVDPGEFLLTATLVNEQFSYREATRALRSGEGEVVPLLERARTIARILSAQPENQAEILPEAGNDRNIPGRQTAQSMIGRLMHFFNVAATAFAERRGIPLLFTNQKVVPQTHAERALLGEYRDQPADPSLIMRMRRMSERLVFATEYSVAPRGHFSLARDAYATFTRPLRHAASFINISNLSASIRGTPLPFPRADIEAIGPYLTKNEIARAQECTRSSQVRVTRMISDISAELAAVSTKEFRTLLTVAVKDDNPPPHVIQELMRRIEEGQFSDPQDIVLVIAGPRPASLGWTEPREKCMEWLEKNKHEARTLFPLAKLNFPEQWTEFDFVLHEKPETWITWATAVVGDKNYTLPARIEITSANQAIKHASFDFWRAFVDGTILEAAEPPLDSMKFVQINCTIPGEFPLPEVAPTEPDLHAANKLHITCSVAGLNPPRFIKTPESGPDGATVHRTTVYGIRERPAVVAEAGHEHPGRATNLTSGYALADIRSEYGIEFVPKAAITETRKRNWRLRAQNGMFYRAPRLKENYSYGPLSDLKGLCRANHLEDPIVVNTTANIVHIAVCIGGKKLEAKGTSKHGAEVAGNVAAKKILALVPSFFRSSEDREALSSDKKDTSTPLGMLYAVAERNGLKAPALRFFSQHFWTRAGASLSVGEKTYSSDSEVQQSERVSANQAAASVLKKLAKHAPELGIEAIPEVAAAPEISRMPTRDYLLKTDAVRELFLLCLQQGHEPPKFKAELGVGKKGKSTRYTCTVVTREGDTITTKARLPGGRSAMSRAGACMLQQLQPCYRGNALYIRKVEILAKEAGVTIGEPAFSEEETERQPKRMLHKCQISCTVDGREFNAVAMRPWKGFAHEVACGLLLENIRNRTDFERRKLARKSQPKKT